MEEKTNANQSQVPLGLYRHYKGNIYRVVGSCRHTETEEDLILYHSDESSELVPQLWVRPIAMFNGFLVPEGSSLSVKRFTYLAGQN